MKNEQTYYVMSEAISIGSSRVLETCVEEEAKQEIKPGAKQEFREGMSTLYSLGYVTLHLPLAMIKGAYNKFKKRMDTLKELGVYDNIEFYE